MPLSHDQGDLVLDFYRQCIVVQVAYEQYEVARGGNHTKQTRETHHLAIGELRHLLSRCQEVDVPAHLVVSLATKHLPAASAQELFTGKEP